MKYIAFPDKLAHVTGGYDIQKMIKNLSLLCYLNQCFLNVDGHLAPNIEYTFVFQYAVELKQFGNDIQTTLHMTCGKVIKGRQ